MCRTSYRVFTYLALSKDPNQKRKDPVCIVHTLIKKMSLALSNPVVASNAAALLAEVLEYGGKRAYAAYKDRPARANSGRSQKKKRQKKSSVPVGMPVGSANSKLAGSARAFTLQNNRSLESFGLLNLVKGSGIDDRERNMVNFRGVNVCMEIENTFNLIQGRPLYLNVAVLTPKALAAPASIPVSDFFRNSGALNRSIDFSNSLSASEFHCLPINTDLYDVVKHKRHMIGPYTSTEGANCIAIKMYIPVNRQIRYEDAGTTPVGKNLFLCYWVDFLGNPGGATPTTCGRISHDITKYFKEPKN